MKHDIHFIQQLNQNSIFTRALNLDNNIIYNVA